MRKVKFNRHFLDIVNPSTPSYTSDSIKSEYLEIYEEYGSDTLFELISEGGFTVVLSLESGKTFSIFTHNFNFE